MTGFTLARILRHFPLLSAVGVLACQPPTPDDTSNETVTSGVDDQTSEDSTGGDDCAVEGDEATPSRCLPSCGADTPCPSGSYCDDGTCAIDCVVDDDCENGRTCGTTGRCETKSEIVLDPKLTDPTSGDEPEEKERPMCIEGQVEFQELIPQVWLLLDRSGSMGSVLDTMTRWDAIGSVLLGDPNDSSDRGVVGTLESDVAFGATFYTTGSGTSGCVLDLESVALSANNYSAIRQRYNKLSPSGNTPTADAVAAVVESAKKTDLTGGKKILVLATDGAPGPCQSRPETATIEVEKEVTEAYLADIETFAISISTGTDVLHMQRVANLGVGLDAEADPPAPYYTAESEDDLAAAFLTIIEGVPRSCEFSLNGSVDEENAGEGTVTLAGEELGYQDENGWILSHPTRVELVGTACEQIQGGEEDLDITFPCSVFEPIIR